MSQKLELLSSASYFSSPFPATNVTLSSNLLFLFNSYAYLNLTKEY